MINIDNSKPVLVTGATGYVACFHKPVLVGGRPVERCQTCLVMLKRRGATT